MSRVVDERNKLFGADDESTSTLRDPMTTPRHHARRRGVSKNSTRFSLASDEPTDGVRAGAASRLGTSGRAARRAIARDANTTHDVRPLLMVRVATRAADARVATLDFGSSSPARTADDAASRPQPPGERVHRRRGARRGVHGRGRRGDARGRSRRRRRASTASRARSTASCGRPTERENSADINACCLPNPSPRAAAPAANAPNAPSAPSGPSAPPRPPRTAAPPRAPSERSRRRGLPRRRHSRPQRSAPTRAAATPHPTLARTHLP